MKTTDLSTRWRELSRIEMRKLVWDRQPWKRHNQAARCYAYRRCSEDAEHNAAIQLGLTVDELRALDRDVEVVDVGAAESAAPPDPHRSEQVS